MQLAHTAHDCLLAVVVSVYPERRVLLGEAGKRLETDAVWGP